MAEQRVVLQQVRGRFDNGITASSGKYHAAYANDSWAIGTHVTLNAGIRWEQQRLTGNVAFHTFTNMWSPRIGIIVDPKGDRKSKIYANFGRYAFVLPLDLALRSLSTESDFLNPYLCSGFDDRRAARLGSPPASSRMRMVLPITRDSSFPIQLTC